MCIWRNEARAGIAHGCNGTSSKTVLTTRPVVVHLRIPESKNYISAFFSASGESFASRVD
jgi:hypothetical protein